MNIYDIIAQDTEQVQNMTFLTRFDIFKCDIIDLPDECFE